MTFEYSQFVDQGAMTGTEMAARRVERLREVYFDLDSELNDMDEEDRCGAIGADLLAKQDALAGELADAGYTLWPTA